MDKEIPYKTLHNRVRRLYGRPSLCEVCGTTTAKRFEWANVTGVYAIGRENWKRMCHSCHSRFDFTDKHKQALNSGKRGRRESPATIEQKREARRQEWRDGRRKLPAHDAGGRFIRHE
jgi:hypothetical protein